MSFSLQAADCYSLLKSGSLLSVCAVIEKFQPPVSLFLTFSFPFLSLFLSWFPSVTSLTSLPPTSSLSFSLSASLLLLPIRILCHLSFDSFSRPPSSHLGRLLSFRTNAAEFDHLRPDHPLNQPLPADEKKGQRNSESSWKTI